MKLPALQVPTPAAGPVHKLQYTIELVGERSVLAEPVRALLNPDWQSALGQPQIFVMAAADTRWRRLDPSDGAAAYDSLLLAWDLLSQQGALSRQSADHLLQVSQNLAQQLSRLAMPIPVPKDVPQSVSILQQLRESFDIGVNLSVISSLGGFPEQAIWEGCKSAGLQYGPTGLFEWRVPGWDYPLLGVGPLGSFDSFNLGQVNRGTIHPAVDIGFSLPHAINPRLALETAFALAAELAASLNGVALDEEDARLDDRTQRAARSNLEAAVQAMSKAGVLPGSPEALKLFG